MNQNYTHVCFLLDRSGSMGGCWKETIASLDNMISEQKKESGKMTLSLWFFDDIIEQGLKFVDIQTINSVKDYASPRGLTSLYEAVVTAIDAEGASLAEMQEQDRPYKVLFVVLTDGGENSSKTWTQKDARQRIDTQKNKYSWQFMFLGADFTIDNITRDLGIVDNGINFSKCKTSSNFKSLNKMMSAYRSADGQSLDKSLIDQYKSEVL